MRILLAEDDESIAVVAKLALERLGGHQVTVVRDGNSAISVALESNYDLILLDSMMPGKDGIRVCCELKQLHQLDTPIIFMSAKSQESDIRESLESGAIGYIQKPFDPKLLCSRISQILDQTDFKAVAA